MKPFQVKDSGKRKKLSGGMVRDITDEKIDYSLILDGPMVKRWAEHLTKGAIKYSKRNWLKGNDKETLERFRESAVRHFFQWVYGDRDEDHASAVYFNVNGYERLKELLGDE